MRKIITKQQVIQAATEETNLHPDKWNTENSDDCPVCIVGSLFRRHLGITNNLSITSYMSKLEGTYSAEDDMEEFYAVDEVNKEEGIPFLNRLSMFFETLLLDNVQDNEEYEQITHNITPKQRRELIKYITDECPDQIKLGWWIYDM